MKRSQSIGTSLSAITGLLVVLLMSIFAIWAIDAFDRQHQAAHTLTAVRIKRDILFAMDALRIESGVSDTAIADADIANTETMEQIIVLHAKSKKALASVIDDLRAHPSNRSTPGFAEIIKTSDRYNRLYPQLVAAVRRPGMLRTAHAAADWAMAITPLAAAMNYQSTALSRGIEGADPFINEMMKINDIAWSVRIDAGADRRGVARAILEARPPAVEAQQEFTEAIGKIDAPWAIIEDDASLPSFPTQLKMAIQRANDVYFVRLRAVRKQIIRSLARGDGATMSGQEWIRFSNLSLNSITAISDTALKLTEAHAAKQVTASNRNFYQTIALMLLSIGLASFTTLYVMWRVIRPLNLITQTMRSVTDDNLRQEIPFEGRLDEIGQFARALRIFRNGTIEKHHLQAELVRNMAAKETAETSNRTKSQFLAAMSHELRTPLNAIIGFSEMIGTEILGPNAPRYRDYAMDIHSAGMHLLALINDILDISKAEAGKLDLHIEQVNLAELIEECVRLVSGQAEEQSLRLAIDIASVPPLFIDRLRIKQILLNLLSNAIKFTPAGGAVSVEAGRDAVSRVVICVRDTGIGIAPEMVSLAFEPFQQIESTLSRKFEGTGLGLSLVKKLVELHGGNVTLESALDKGTSVTISFPASCCESVPLARSA